jgi:hypothetical protein
MEVGSVAGKNDDRAGRMGVQLLGVKLITKPDVENAGNDRVDPIFGVCAASTSHPQVP